MVREYVNDIAVHTGYDRDTWAVWDEWVTSATMPASRQVAIQRLRLLGVLGLTPYAGAPTGAGATAPALLATQ